MVHIATQLPRSLKIGNNIFRFLFLYARASFFILFFSQIVGIFSGTFNFQVAAGVTK